MKNEEDSEERRIGERDKGGNAEEWALFKLGAAQEKWWNSGGFSSPGSSFLLRHGLPRPVAQSSDDQ